MSSADIKEAVRERYSEAARRVSEGGSCCGGKSACVDTNPITSNLYDVTEKGALPEAAVLASLGCGNPTALAQLKAGETVLDLGSGGGIDVLLSARRVGPTGKAYGLDMTDEMLALARQNQKAAGVENVEFIKGEIENIPLPDNSVDVIISNCVINLSADKDKVIKEAFRVLKPGGRFAVSDIVTRGEMPEQIRRQVLLWSGCIAGALQDTEYAKQARRGGLRRHRHRAHARVHRRRRARVRERQGHRCGRNRPVHRRQIHERLRARQEACERVPAAARPPAADPKGELNDRKGKPMSDSIFNVLFLCTGNTARSVMAECIMQPEGARKFRAFSAGSQPKGVYRSR